MSKQNYAVCCYTCEHNGKETCKGCDTILNGENEPYENWQLREDLCQKDKQIADLQHRLKVAEIALGKACKKLQDNYCINCDNQTNCSRVEMCEMSLNSYLPSDFKEQAEEEIKGE